MKELQQLLLESPIFFFAMIMLTEPLTAPPTRNSKRIYALITGILYVPQIHVGPVYSTPELALVLGNIYSYIVSPKQKVVLRLKRKKKIAADIVDFVFKPSQRLQFEPGQYVELTLAHTKADSRGNRRYFTLASSPTEGDLHLGVRFYDNSSSFKRALYNLNGNTPIMAGSVAGDFTLPRDTRQKLVFIAGGIGITPFRSMLRYLLDRQQRRDIVIFYANRTADEIAYADILREAQVKLGIRVYCTLTDAHALPRNWPGLVGRIDQRMIEQTVPDYQERTFYLSGPLEMVQAYERLLSEMHVRHEQIKTDFFSGFAMRPVLSHMDEVDNV